MKTSDIARWSETDWKTRVRYAMPSGGGSVGVVFVWAEQPPIRPNPKVGTASFIIKPIKGSAAPTKFAELVLSKLAKATSPNSKGILHSQGTNRNSGKFIEEMLQKFKSMESDHLLVQRWGQVWPAYQTANSYLIQDNQQGITEFGDEYRTLWGLSTLLLNSKLMENLGRLFVADAMIGNGDRLCSPNTSNIVFKGNGQICAIDSATILASYEGFLKDTTNVSWAISTFDDEKSNPKGWTRAVVEGALAVPTDDEIAHHKKTFEPPKVSPPSFGMEVLFNPGDWFDRTFKSHLQDGLQKLGISDQDPDDFEWNLGKTAFLKGVALGEKELDKQLSGFNWLLVKSSYKSYVKKYGGDPNLDWTNFKLRRRYFKARRKGMSAEDAMEDARQYAAKKHG